MIVPTSTKEIVVLEYLVLNERALRNAIRPECEEFLKRRIWFVDMLPEFNKAYQRFVVNSVLTFLVPGFQLTPEECLSVVTFDVLHKIWSIDVDGYLV